MTETQNPAQAVSELGLTIDSRFVPFSQSRNAKPTHGRDKPWRSLNWIVTLSRNGKPVVTVDYSAGEAHCPAYDAKIKPSIKSLAIDFEIESGYQARLHGVFSVRGTIVTPYKEHFTAIEARPILPDPLDVIHSILCDCDVLNYPSFEEWASICGYDADSRNAESIYRECMKTALALRAAIGSDGLERLQVAFQDY